MDTCQHIFWCYHQQMLLSYLHQMSHLSPSFTTTTLRPVLRQVPDLVERRTPTPVLHETEPALHAAPLLVHLLALPVLQHARLSLQVVPLVTLRTRPLPVVLRAVVRYRNATVLSHVPPFRTFQTDLIVPVPSSTPQIIRSLLVELIPNALPIL